MKRLSMSSPTISGTSAGETWPPSSVIAVAPAMMITSPAAAKQPLNDPQQHIESPRRISPTALSNDDRRDRHVALFSTTLNSSYKKMLLTCRSGRPSFDE
jgi:hypothetical protein